MEIKDKKKEFNSSTITDEQRNEFMYRFKKACRQRGMSVGYLQGKIGKANAYFRNMGFISHKMSAEVRKYIPDLNIEYINTGVGEMFLTQKQMDEEPVADGYSVPLVPLNAMGGTLSGFAESVKIEDCEIIISPVKEAKIVITVSGDSMSPEFPSGCIVFLKKVDENTFIEWGKTYVLDTCNGVVIKKLFPAPEDEGRIICRSVNPEYPDYMIKKSDVYGFYKVLLQMSLK